MLLKTPIDKGSPEDRNLKITPAVVFGFSLFFVAFSLYAMGTVPIGPSGFETIAGNGEFCLTWNPATSAIRGNFP